MQAAAVVVARAGSKGLPGKNAKTVGGIPMVSRAVIALRSAGSVIDRILVSTDGDDIAYYARTAGATVIRRPDDISGDHARIEDAVRHALRESYGDALPEAVLIVQPNLPIWQPGIIRRVLEVLEQKDVTCALTAVPIIDRPEWMLRDGGGFAEFYLHKPCIPAQRQELPELCHVDGQLVAVRMDTFMQPSAALYLGYAGPNIKLVIRDRLWAFDVEHPADLVMADALDAWLKEKVVLGG